MKGGLPRVAASQSFTAEEVSALDQLVQIVLRGGDTRVCAKNAAFPNIARKVAGMKSAVAKAKAAREDPTRVRVEKPAIVRDDPSEDD